MSYLFLFYCKNGYANASQFYVYMHVACPVKITYKNDSVLIWLLFRLQVSAAL